MIGCMKYFHFSLGLIASFLLTMEPGLAQVGEADIFSGKVGVLEFKFTGPPAGWKETSESRLKAREILRAEGVTVEPAFAFENQKTGGFLFGTWSPFTDGFALDAQQMYADPPFFPSAWGLKADQISRYLSPQSSKEMAFTWLRALGQGDGKTFAGKSKAIKTLGIFVTMPIQFENGLSVSSGMVSLDYRGPESGEVKNTKTPADNLISMLIENLKPQANISLISSSAFRAKVAQSSKDTVQNGASEKLSSKAVSEQPAVSSESQMKAGEVASTISRINIELLQEYKNWARDSRSPLVPTADMMLKCGGPGHIKGASLKDLQDSTIENNLAHIKCESLVKQWIDWYNVQKGKK